jgi:cystathionine beta-lyase
MIDRPLKDDTVIGHAGNHPARHHGIVNPPVYHASTVLFPTLAALEESVRHLNEPGRVHYGRYGTPTVFALEEAVARLEGGEQAIALPSGLAAITVALTAFLGAGDHLLMVDTVYGPVRKFCDNHLARFGVETTYYDPLIGDGIAALIRPDTRVVYLESPGSLTFEVQDVPAIAAAARAAGAVVVMDNTWATPLFCKPFGLGVDVSIHAATKYIVGHSDAMLGLVVTRDALFPTLKATAHGFGHAAAPDDCYLALRGFRTLSVRLQRHQATGLILARWLLQRPEVARVLHPALPDAAGHALWKRDFSGASGLFGVILNSFPKSAVAAMVDGMTLFGMGFSWGGYESLILPVRPESVRSATRWTAPGPTLRVHAGLEDPEDLIADLAAGFDRLTAAARSAGQDR